VKNIGCHLPKFQTGLALVLFGVNDKTEVRAEGVNFRHKVRLSSARSLNKALKAQTFKVTSAGASGEGVWPPVEKLAPWATAREDLLPVLRMHTLLERSYSTRTTVKRTNFPRQFDTPD